MPGLFLIQRFVARKEPLSIEFQKASTGSHPLPGYRESIYIHTEGMILGAAAYAAYPLTFMEDQDHRVLLEGRLYNIPGQNLPFELRNIARRVFCDPPDPDSIRGWLESMDGDFILFLNDKRTGRTAVLNDIFGRLPLYYRYDHERLSLSRDIRFLYGQMEPLEVDRLSLAHFLMLGHALEEKTVWKGIRLLTPGSLLRTDPSQKQVTVHRMHCFDFSISGYGNESVARNAERLAEKFVIACRTRAGEGSHRLVSLSGGLDSRAVAAGLHAGGASFSTATFYQKGYTSNVEIRCARQVAHCLNAPWETIGLGRIRCPDALELLNIKAGFSPLYMAFILEYFRELQQRYGREITHFTGDGGDQCMPALRPPVPMTHLRGLADYIIQDNYLGGRRLGAGLAAALTGLDQTDLRESLLDHLNSFPEKSLEGKWLHMQFYGIGVKICFQAEDRNRCFFWSTSPFYSTSFYSDAIQCPQSQKSQFDLYRHFLTTLSPKLAGLEYSGYDGPLGSTRLYLNHAVKRMKFIRPAWTLHLKHLLKGVDSLPAEAILFRIMKQAMQARPALGEALDFNQINRIIENSAGYDRYHVFHLFSALFMLELGLFGDSTLSRYPNVFLV